MQASTGFFIPLAFAFLIHLAPTLAASAAQWRTRSIYQIMTDRFARTDGSSTAACDVDDYDYCGGSWKGIEKNLDYISGMGFDAIWISPVTKNVAQGYHGYWQSDLYALNENFGTEQDLLDLSDALHARKMYLMVDGVTNHFGSETAAPNVDYSVYNPFNDGKYFHPYCAMDYDNLTSAELCWMYDNLPDVRTEDASIVQIYSAWIKDLISKYNIDGLRVDSAKHVDKASLTAFCEAANVYCLLEVANGDPEYAYPYQDVVGDGRAAGITNYPLYYAFTQTFLTGGTNRTMEDFAYNVYQNANATDTSLHGTFTENHDNPRIAWYNADTAIAKAALAFTVLTDGIPIVWQGQEQHLDGADDPGCREAMWLSSSGGMSTDSELYQYTTMLNKIRRHAINKTAGWWTRRMARVLNYSEDTVALRKGALRMLLTTAGSGQAVGTWVVRDTGFTEGEKVVDLIACDVFTAGPDGDVEVDTGAGAVVVLATTAFAAGSGLCDL